MFGSGSTLGTHLSLSVPRQLSNGSLQSLQSARLVSKLTVGQIWSNITSLNREMGREDVPFALDY